MKTLMAILAVVAAAAGLVATFVLIVAVVGLARDGWGSVAVRRHRRAEKLLPTEKAADMRQVHRLFDQMVFAGKPLDGRLLPAMTAATAAIRSGERLRAERALAALASLANRY